MKLFLIIIGTIYLFTVLYCSIASTAIAQKVKRKIKFLRPDLYDIKTPYSISERICGFIPFCVPLIHIALSLTFMFSADKITDTAYKKVIVEREKYIGVISNEESKN